MKRPWVLAYVILFGLFAFSRFALLTARPMHNDEGVNGFFVHKLVSENKWSYDPANYHGPTLFYFQVIPSWIAGLSVFTVRGTIALAGLLALAAILLCGGFLGRWGTLAAVFLAGTSCNFLFYSRYFIHETYLVLFTFGVFLAAYFFKKTGRPLYFYLGLLSATLIFCTKETGVIHMAILVAAYVMTQIITNTLDGQPLKRSYTSMKTDFAWPISRLRWHILGALALCMVVWALLFTSFFKNMDGMAGSFTAYLPWTKQGLESGHIKPWFYFIKDLLFTYEFPLTLLTTVGAVIAFVKNDKKGVFLSLWALMMIGAYSAIPYKTPWCVINFVFPMALVSGYTIQTAMDWLNENGSILLKKRAYVVMGLAAAAFIVPTFIATYVINYREYDDEKHKQVYVHTSRDIFRLIDTIKDIGRKTGEGKDILINEVSQEYWPLPFYLKDFTNAKFWGKTQNVSPLDAPLIIAQSKQHSELKKHLRGSYSIMNFVLRPGVNIDLWINNRHIEGTEPMTSVPDLLTSLNPGGLSAGLTREVFSGLACEGSPVLISRDSNLDLYFDAEKKKPIAAPLCMKWSGFIKIPSTGIYRFSLDSDDGSMLYLDGTLVIDNGGNHSLMRASRSVSLSEGLHKFELRYTDAGGYAELSAYWKQPEKVEEKIPQRVFFTR